MKKFLLTLTTLCIINCSVFATEYSDYAISHQETSLKQHTTITVKREHIEEYEQYIGSQYIPAIVYGYGDLKIKGQKKKRISYICLLNKELKPVWSYIIPR